MKLPGIRQGAGAQGRPPSQRWFAEEVRKERIEAKRDLEKHLSCADTKTNRNEHALFLSYTFSVVLETMRTNINLNWQFLHLKNPKAF